jgi:hypothetical protein
LPASRFRWLKRPPLPPVAPIGIAGTGGVGTAPLRTVPPPSTLLDVRLIGMSPSAFSLTGFERVEGVEYAQSWLVQDTA